MTGRLAQVLASFVFLRMDLTDFHLCFPSAYCSYIVRCANCLQAIHLSAYGFFHGQLKPLSLRPPLQGPTTTTFVQFSFCTIDCDSCHRSISTLRTPTYIQSLTFFPVCYFIHQRSNVLKFSLVLPPLRLLHTRPTPDSDLNDSPV